jgi:predicted MPP superfamily phosphohydrolase
LRLLPPRDGHRRARRALNALLVGNVLVLPATLVATLRAPANVAACSVPIAHVAFADVGFCIVLAFALVLRDAAWFATLGDLRARHGVFVVTGNHEFFYGASEWMETWRTMGLRVLDDEHHEGARIALIGVNDKARGASHTNRSAVIARARGGMTRGDVDVLLAHRPSDAEHAAALGIDVQLSGHIHAGQFVPLAWLVRRVEPYFAGLYRVGRMQLYVNSGAGYWGPPNRLGAQQEVALVEVSGARRS